METRKINDQDIRRFYELNTWRDETKSKVRAALEKGVWVHLGSTASGHTRAAMTEMDGLNWLKSEYGDVLQIAEREGWGEICARLR